MTRTPAAFIRTLILSVVASCAVPWTADAGEGVTDAQQEAIALFQQSAEHYRAGQFQQAVDLLKRAYALKPEPVLLYNLSRA